ncbi:MAG: GTP-binding protein, partial [Treponema sp.]|nr:GTP-binding protein [Treponema sp.]
MSYIGHETPLANRVHIGFFGRRNAGKSSLLNALTGQEIAIVSETKGTTTDPVYKTMELLPLGPVVIIDTPGIDDTGPLGDLRVRRAKQVLNKTDTAVLVVDGETGKDPADEELVRLFRAKGIPFIVAYNKSDLAPERAALVTAAGTGVGEHSIAVSAKTGENVEALKERIAALARTEEPKLRIAADLVGGGDFVVLVTPIDKAAPKGRLILPQQQT